MIADLLLKTDAPDSIFILRENSWKLLLRGADLPALELPGSQEDKKHRNGFMNELTVNKGDGVRLVIFIQWYSKKVISGCGKQTVKDIFRFSVESCAQPTILLQYPTMKKSSCCEKGKTFMRVSLAA